MISINYIYIILSIVIIWILYILVYFTDQRRALMEFLCVLTGRNSTNLRKRKIRNDHRREKKKKVRREWVYTSKWESGWLKDREKRDRKERRVKKEADETGRLWKWYLFVQTVLEHPVVLERVQSWKFASFFSLTCTVMRCMLKEREWMTVSIARSRLPHVSFASYVNLQWNIWVWKIALIMTSILRTIL